MSKGPIYTHLINSARWRHLRRETLAAHPYCDRCEKLYNLITPAVCVHHIEPAESAHNEAECAALMFNPSNLQCLCAACHHDIHTAAGYHTKPVVKERKALKLNAILADMYGSDTSGA